jgi:hypothetical protein
MNNPRLLIVAMAVLLIAGFVIAGCETVEPDSPVATGVTPGVLAKDSPLTINIAGTMNASGGVDGTFTATGGISSSGTTSETVTLDNGNFSGQTIFTDSKGSFTAQTSGTYSFSSATSGSGSGVWVITSGTGYYKFFSGSGTLTFTIDLSVSPGTVNDLWTGTVSKDGGNGHKHFPWF